MKTTESSTNLGITRETVYRCGAVSRSVAVVSICARFHVDTTAYEAILRAFDCLEDIETVDARELFVFASAVARRHSINCERWTRAVSRVA